MGRFIRKLKFFVVLLIVLWLCCELFYRLVPSNYTVKHHNIVSANDTKILILGNSHTLYGLNPKFFNLSTFNLANVSQTVLYDKLLFEKHVDHLNELKYVIIPVEYSSLSQKDRVPELEWRKYFYEDQMDLHTGLISEFDIKKYSLALVPRFRITVNALKQYYNKGTLVECQSNGWAGRAGVGPDNSAAMGKNIANKHEDGSVDFTNNLKRLECIIKTCREKNIKVLLVTMPVTTHYAIEVNQEKLVKIFKVCKDAEVSNPAVRYLNLFNDRRFTNSDFYDVDHLNITGAAKCSEIVNEAVKDW